MRRETERKLNDILKQNGLSMIHASGHYKVVNQSGKLLDVVSCSPKDTNAPKNTIRRLVQSGSIRETYIERGKEVKVKTITFQ